MEGVGLSSMTAESVLGDHESAITNEDDHCLMQIIHSALAIFIGDRRVVIAQVSFCEVILERRLKHCDGFESGDCLASVSAFLRIGISNGVGRAGAYTLLLIFWRMPRFDNAFKEVIDVALHA